MDTPLWLCRDRLSRIVMRDMMEETIFSQYEAITFVIALHIDVVRKESHCSCYDSSHTIIVAFVRIITMRLLVRKVQVEDARHPLS